MILSSFVTPHIHLSILFPVPSTTPMYLPVHQCWSYYCSVHLPLSDLHVDSPYRITFQTLSSSSSTRNLNDYCIN